MTTKELEYAIYKKYFNSSILTITNLRTVVKKKRRYLIGFELKISKADLLADFKKKHNHACSHEILDSEIKRIKKWRIG